MISRNFNKYEFSGVWYSFNKYKTILFDIFLGIIKPYLKNVTEKKREPGQWKIQLPGKIIFKSSEDIDEYPYMYSWSDNKDILNLFESLLTSYQELLKYRMKGSDFIFDYVDGLSFYVKIGLSCGGSYKASPY